MCQLRSPHSRTGLQMCLRSELSLLPSLQIHMLAATPKSTAVELDHASENQIDSASLYSALNAACPHKSSRVYFLPNKRFT